MKKYIAYYRVSTKRQGTSGLGLEAQKKMVNDFVKCDDCIIESFTDIESGKKDNRPQLNKAIEACIKLNATLVIAKIDRLSRRLSFVAALMESKVKFVAVDMPEANDFTIHIFAAMAEQERKFIVQRTKDGLAAKKRRGETLGNISNLTDEGRRLGPVKMKEKAKTNNNNVRATGYIALLRQGGKTLQEIALILNKEGFKSSMGKEFTPMQVSRLIAKC